MKLSEHLSLKEVTYSTTAIKNGINNKPNIGQLLVLKEMAANSAKNNESVSPKTV